MRVPIKTMIKIAMLVMDECERPGLWPMYTHTNRATAVTVIMFENIEV